MVLDFYTFNLLEGVFWIALAFVVVFYAMRDLPRCYKLLSAYTATTLFIFGLSDFLENYVGGLQPGNYWLFVIKALIVFGQAVAVFLFIWFRARESGEVVLD